MVPGLTLVPQRASVMSSTRRTDTPARYISMSASSTDASRRRYRSMMAVSKVCRRSFGMFSTGLSLQLTLVVACPGIGPGVITLVLLRVAEPVRLGFQHPVQGVFDSAANHFAKMVSYGTFIQLDEFALWCTIVFHGSVLLSG